MDRTEQILRGLELSNPGVEIGPSYNPIAPKHDGYNVSIIDHLDQDGLIAKYSAHEVDTSRIEPVDYVWSGQPYRELVGDKRFAWVLASHVIEHAPDLIAFINDVDAILTPTGILSLAVPDKRFCFDHYRSTSDLARVIDTHERKPSWPSVGAVAEHYLNAAQLNGLIIWGAGTAGTPALIHPLEDAKARMDEVAQRRNYHDAHSWTFTPASFRLLFEDLYQLGLIALREVAPAVSGAGEFYIKLSRSGGGPQQSRQALAIQAAAER